MERALQKYLNPSRTLPGDQYLQKCFRQEWHPQRIVRLRQILSFILVIVTFVSVFSPFGLSLSFLASSSFTFSSIAMAESPSRAVSPTRSGEVNQGDAKKKKQAACENSLRVRPGVIIDPRARSLIQSFASEFCTETGKPLVVTSALRKPSHQARLMLQRLNKGDRLRYYQNQEAVSEILQVYDEAVRSKQSPLQALSALLTDQVSRDCYVSKHLFSRAFDVARFDPKFPITEHDELRLRALAKQKRVYVIDNEGGRKDHYHLNFPPYPHDPRKCPGEYGSTDD